MRLPIVGYCGHRKGEKSENMFAKNYRETTLMATQNLRKTLNSPTAAKWSDWLASVWALIVLTGCTGAVASINYLYILAEEVGARWMEAFQMEKWGRTINQWFMTHWAKLKRKRMHQPNKTGQMTISACSINSVQFSGDQTSERVSNYDVMYGDVWCYDHYLN